MNQPSIASLPRIVRFLGTDDSPGSCCPHCGAEGRYTLRFQVEDGRTMGAMRGCVQLFPVSRVATEELRLREKLAALVKRFGQGATLNRRDAEALTHARISSRARETSAAPSALSTAPSERIRRGIGDERMRGLRHRESGKVGLVRVEQEPA